MSPDVLALLALGEGAADDLEQAHLDSCADCRAELAGLSRVVESGRRTDPADALLTPPPQVWRGIRAELGLDPNLASVSVLNVAPAPAAAPSPTDQTGDGAAYPTEPMRPRQVAVRPSQPRRWVPVVLAACLALIIGIGLGLGVPRLTQPREVVVSRADLVALPAWSGANGRAVVEEDSAGNRTLVVTVDSQLPPGAARQVWLIDSQVKGMSSMGYLSNGRGSFTIPDRMNLNEFPIVDVSAEPGNDGNPLHSGNSIVRGTLSPT